MSGRDPAFNSTILEILRPRVNPGAWATERIELEDAEALKMLIGEVKALLTKKLDAKLNHEVRIISTITDAMEQREAQRDSINWGTTISEAISNLAPLEAQLSQVRTQGQKHIKNQLVEKMRAIAQMIDGRRINM